jgi:hypothetical protein
MRARMTIVLVALVAVLSMVGSSAAQPAGTLVVGLVAEPVNLDPAQQFVVLRPHSSCSRASRSS